MIPIGTDQYARRTPVATLALIALSVTSYAAMLLVERNLGPQGMSDLLAFGSLSARNFRFWQPVTYQFMHDPGSVLHLAGNMLFLWMFGSAVEGRVRGLGFVLLYLTGGVVAGLAQLALAKGSSVIGASGSVSAVTGAFIVFFPRARVTVFLLMALVPMPALLLVGIYMALDFLGALGLRGGGVAYLAHLGGLAFGCTAAATLLWAHIVKRTDMDMLYLIRQWRRRAEMGSAVRHGQGETPWRGQAPPLRVAANAPAAPAMVEPRVPNTRLAARLIEDATSAFAKGEFAKAADAYQRALDAAPAAHDADQTRLMLAIIYGRKLNEPERAGEQLRAIGSGLPPHLRELEAALRGEVRA